MADGHAMLNVCLHRVRNVRHNAVHDTMWGIIFPSDHCLTLLNARGLPVALAAWRGSIVM